MMVTPSRPRPPLKYHGGKHYLAAKIVALMPPHTHYVEPFAGGLSVLLAKDPDGVSEVVNDLDGRVSNFWRVLQGDDSFAQFHRIMEAVPFSEAEWADAGEPAGGPVRPVAGPFHKFCRAGGLVGTPVEVGHLPAPAGQACDLALGA